jgi:hypothetical protein
MDSTVITQHARREDVMGGLIPVIAPTHPGDDVSASAAFLVSIIERDREA